jgi:eukaryotic-like serine/threonine-protein kinase
MSRAPEDVATIVERALALGPRERSEYVRHACGSDETLLSHVLLGIGEDVSKSGFWDEVAAGETGAHEPSSALEGQRLGTYRIVPKLGTGGMGDVYLAERADDEYQQQVAIKMVRSGMFSRQVQSRLRTER